MYYLLNNYMPELIGDSVLSSIGNATARISPHKSFAPTYRVIPAIRKTNKALFFMPAWGVSPVTYTYLAQRLRTTHNIVLFYYPREILSPDIDKSFKYYGEILAKAHLSIQELEDDGVDDFAIFGTSLGSAVTVYVANKTKRFNKIILSVPGNSGADTLWESEHRTVLEIRKEFEKKGYDQDSLRRILADVDPEANLGNLGNSKILLFLGRTDKIIPFELQKKLVKKVKENHIECKTVERQFGHYITVIQSLFDYGTIAHFLAE